ncbi:PREDICTED: sorbitol dehydrogenase-like, partial [Papilio polytes]|uniref:sorbitol dehydrogenase-like n=1 Tax=Papilio polytes TaxID=76194 RepID=UPI0006768BAF
CSTPAAPGNLSQYYKHVADFCHKLPENLSMEEGAAVQPLAIAIHKFSQLPLKITYLYIISDVVQSRLDIAKQLAADYTLLIKKEYSDEEVVEKIRAALGGRPRITIDACAFPSAQRVSMLVTKKGGTILIVGVGDTTVEVPLSGAVLREIDVKGSNRILNT